MELDFSVKLPATMAKEKAVPLDTTKIYDVIIIGGGAAGLTAAIYCLRKGAKTGLIAKKIGGQILETSTIENYMGYMYIEGAELVKKFSEQVEQFEIGINEGLNVVSLTADPIKQVKAEDGSVYQARAVIVATGMSYRHLNVPGEEELKGKGVAYCATCDAPLYEDKRVAVIGGGNSGVDAAIDLARIATHVHLIQDLEDLTADKILISKLGEFNNVEILFGHLADSIKGTNKVESLVVKNRSTGEKKEIPLDGIFVEIGLKPNTAFLKGLLDLTKMGEIKVDYSCRTNRAGIFAAGDVSSVPYKQIIIAAGEGAKAGLSAYDYVLRT